MLHRLLLIAGLGLVLVATGGAFIASRLRYDVCRVPVVGALFPSCRALAALPALPDPSYADIPPQLGEQLRAAQRDAEAHPRNAISVGRFGMTLLAYRLNPAAAPVLARAQALQPDEVAWPYFLGTALFRLNRLDEAVAQMKRALELRPQYLPAKFYIADHILKVDPATSLPLFRELIAQNPDLGLARYGLGLALAGTGASAEAAEHLEMVVDAFRNFRPAHYALAQVYLKLNERAKAREQLALNGKVSGTTLPPFDDPLMARVTAFDHSPGAATTRAARLMGELRYAEAEQELKQALQIDPRWAAALLNLISLYTSQENFEQAEQTYRSLLAFAPNQPRAHFLYSYTLARQKRFAEARETLQRELGLDPVNLDTRTRLGRMAELDGHDDVAEATYRAVIETDPDFRPARSRLGRLLLRKGQAEAAIGQLRAAAALHDTEWDRYALMLANAYAETGNAEAAWDYYRTAYRDAVSRGRTALAATIANYADKIGLDLGN